MNVSFHCRDCEQPVSLEAPLDSLELTCPACRKGTPISREEFSGGQLHACLVCGCRELFVRKDFPQRLGVAIVIAGLIASTIALAFHQRLVSYGILFATALIDLVLYFTVNNMLQCYRCQATYRGLEGLEEFEPFKLETHEKFRQQSIRLARAKGRGG
jgi:hypothetical protein